MEPTIKVNVISLHLKEISEDPFLTPEALGLREYMDTEKRRVEKYFELLSECCFQTPLKVWYQNGKHLLLEDYECLIATRKYLKPDDKVTCLAIQGLNIAQAKQLSMMLRNVNRLETPLSRLLTIYTLQQLDFSNSKIRDFYGVKKVHSSEGRRIQRDFRMVKHVSIFKRLLGFSSEELNQAVGSLGLLRPRIFKATLNLSLADKIIERINDDENKFREFDRLYEEYLNVLRRSHITEDEEVKPVFTWTKFDRENVLAIASKVARGQDKLSFNQKYLFGDSHLPDHRWSIKYNELTKDLSVSQIKLNLSRKSDDNIKKIVELTYKMESFGYSLKSYLARIRPIAHGAKIRVLNSEIEPALETASNMPKFEDYSYFEFILKNKLLYYCNRELLLKCLDLRAHNFGFTDYRYDSPSTYQKAKECFSEWWEKSYKTIVELHYNGRFDRHPKFKILESINVFLLKNANDDSSIFFGDFVNKLFSRACGDLDIYVEHREKQAEIASHFDSEIRSDLWKCTLERVKQIGVTEENLKELARELYWPEEQRMTSMFSKLDRHLQLLANHFVDVKATGNPITLLPEHSPVHDDSEKHF